MIGLTRRQELLLSFLKKQIAEKDIPPSFDEMKDHLGLSSKSGIARLVNGLEERGLIRRLHSRARAIEIVDPLRHELWFLSNEALTWVDYGAKRRAIPREMLIDQIVSDWARLESTRRAGRFPNRCRHDCQDRLPDQPGAGSLCLILPGTRQGRASTA